IRPLTKIQGAIKGSTSKEKGQPHREVGLVVWACAQRVWLLSFDFPALDGAFNFRKRAGKRPGTV
ncbi:hypothetical protein, partial [Ralstonia pickettii]|uniref:hypothetical protein n=1 Tax=Ralstonia pickettii TaxID=329 RepID=UPI002D788389